MKQQRICIIGDGLAGLTTAVILSKENIRIDIYGSKNEKKQNLDKRTTAVSESNFQYIKNNLNCAQCFECFQSKKAHNLNYHHYTRLILVKYVL